MCISYLWQIAADVVQDVHTVLLAHSLYGGVPNTHTVLLSAYLYDGVVDVHVVLLANGCRWQLAQQHLYWYEELQNAHLLPACLLVAVIASICQCPCCFRLHTRQQALVLEPRKVGMCGPGGGGISAGFVGAQIKAIGSTDGSALYLRSSW